MRQVLVSIDHDCLFRGDAFETTQILVVSRSLVFAVTSTVWTEIAVLSLNCMK